MPTLPSADLNRLYLAELRGDTLLLTPRGDAAGFSAATASGELAKLLEWAQQSAVKHLVVDLSSANYFGSVVIGALVQLGQTFRDQGGRIALSGASSDMQDVLRVLKLDTMWEQFPTANRAINDIASIPLGERLWLNRRWLGAGAVVVAAILLYVFLPRTNYGRIYYTQLSPLWREAMDKRDSLGQEEWARLVKQHEKQLEPIVYDLLRRGRSRQLNNTEKAVLFAARDHWLDALDRSRPEIAERHAQLTKAYLRAAESSIEGRPIQVPIPPSPELDVETGNRPWHNRNWKPGNTSDPARKLGEIP
jgi:anti-anti-sigma factor